MAEVTIVTKIEFDSITDAKIFANGCSENHFAQALVPTVTDELEKFGLDTYHISTWINYQLE
jgi:hypothetical protein